MLTVTPGNAFAYSNLGAGILGHVLTQAAAAERWETLVQARVAGPLGLVDTTVTLSEGQAERRVSGYDGLAPAPQNDIGEPLRGAGALLSTGDDLLAFVEAALAGDDAAWELVVTPRRDSPFGEDAQTGFLLNIENPSGEGLYAKSGSTTGFSAQLMFTRSPPAAVVILANNGRLSGLHDLAYAILTAAR